MCIRDSFTKPEICARTWLTGKVADNAIVYTDAKGLLQRGPGPSLASFPLRDEQISRDSYMFLRRWNVIHGEWRRSDATGASLFPLELLKYLSGMNKIYDSGEAQILRP